MRPFLLSILFLLSFISRGAARNLDIFFVDVEGGQATLIVSPSGESMLVDTGSPGFDGRDADRIVAAAKSAGVGQIDYLVITHYHGDHVGGVFQLAAKIPIVHFVDHGPNVATEKGTDELFAAYREVRDKGKHILVRPGDKIPIKGLDVTVLTAAGERLRKPLRGAGAPNPLCASATRRSEDTTENAQSVGTLIKHGKFRMINLGDLTWNKEMELACPANLVGSVDVYLTTHHGIAPSDEWNASGLPALVHALRPRVAIMNNGARKGGSPDTWQSLRSSPGIEDIWQIHYTVESGKENNAPEQFIANPEENCQGFGIKLSVSADGSYTVTNLRNGNSKTYQTR